MVYRWFCENYCISLNPKCNFFFFFNISWTRASLLAQLVKICLQCRGLWFDCWVGKIPWRRGRLPTPVFMGFPGGSDSKESACNEGDLGSIPGSGRFPGGGHGNPLQYSCLENSMDPGAWQSTDRGVTKRQTRLSD